MTFRPSTNAFAFRNSFPDEPVIRVGPLSFGHASRGLCGGMAFAVRDYFDAERTPPPDPAPPAEGSPLYRFIVKRLFAAFDLPSGPVRYLRWMSASDADARTRTRAETVPALRQALTSGRPCPLGVVAATGWNPNGLRHNHVVLAYDLLEDGDTATISVYDPNSGPSDDVTVVLTPDAIKSGINIGNDVRGLFPLRYQAVRPPG